MALTDHTSSSCIPWTTCDGQVAVEPSATRNRVCKAAEVDPIPLCPVSRSISSADGSPVAYPLTPDDFSAELPAGTDSAIITVTWELSPSILPTQVPAGSSTTVTLTATTNQGIEASCSTTVTVLRAELSMSKEPSSPVSATKLLVQPRFALEKLVFQNLHKPRIPRT